MRLAAFLLLGVGGWGLAASFTPVAPPNRNPGGVASLQCKLSNKAKAPEAVVLLVRHGQTEWNVAGRYQGSLDSPLTTRGLEQAQMLGERLRRSGRAIDSVWSSDMPRARRTCELIADAIGFPVAECKVDADLRERCFGVFEGLDRQEIQQRYPQELAGTLKFDLDHKVPGGESRREVLSRVNEKLEEIADANAGKTVLVVTHGACLNTMMRHLLGIPWSPDVKPPGELKIGNTCMCELHYIKDECGEARWVVHSIGDVAHTQDPTLLWSQDDDSSSSDGVEGKLRAAREKIAILEAEIASVRGVSSTFAESAASPVES